MNATIDAGCELVSEALNEAREFLSDNRIPKGYAPTNQQFKNALRTILASVGRTGVISRAQFFLLEFHLSCRRKMITHNKELLENGTLQQLRNCYEKIIDRVSATVPQNGDPKASRSGSSLKGHLRGWLNAAESHYVWSLSPQARLLISWLQEHGGGIEELATELKIAERAAAAPASVYENLF